MHLSISIVLCCFIQKQKQFITNIIYKTFFCKIRGADTYLCLVWQQKVVIKADRYSACNPNIFNGVSMIAVG